MTPHPILAAVCDVRAWLKAVAGANPTSMTVDDKAAALRELAAAEAQLAKLRLRILDVVAPEIAEATEAAA